MATAWRHSVTQGTLLVLVILLPGRQKSLSLARPNQSSIRFVLLRQYTIYTQSTTTTSARGLLAAINL